ncbi:MAG: enoyl-CoA hydratase/isomerase family protein [Rhizobiales bacterium]|nr:enoyl-CoA hydratase-related protein [Hyphomicrobiales bacterium]NRB13026.1 enoyl-CoA hydratase/isomerase family protein [Hyphomicrobiales bacterium]
MDYNVIEVETHGRVGLIRFNKPKTLNALGDDIASELAHAARAFDADADIGVIMLTGAGKAFVAGADISEMVKLSFNDVYDSNYFTGTHDVIADIRKPTIAAVNGFALGGGCELALMCDMIIASNRAKFGQPEINLGTLPGMGGSQRLARSIGKQLTMDLCLTGRMITAQEAMDMGFVSRVFDSETFAEDALGVAQEVASKSLIATIRVKEAVNRAFETTLQEGLLAEQRLFYGSFATEDRTEGMQAFLDKRPAQWKHK